MADFNVAQCLMNDGGFSTDEMQDILAEAEEDESVLVHYLSDEVEIDPRPVKSAVFRAAVCVQMSVPQLIPPPRTLEIPQPDLPADWL